jgi:Ca2+/Na+ antiporter
MSIVSSIIRPVGNRFVEVIVNINMCSEGFKMLYNENKPR